MPNNVTPLRTEDTSSWRSKNAHKLISSVSATWSPPGVDHRSAHRSTRLPAVPQNLPHDRWPNGDRPPVRPPLLSIHARGLDIRQARCYLGAVVLCTLGLMVRIVTLRLRSVYHIMWCTLQTYDQD
ncbi:hypothetical protein DAEQUDRAFT_729032 [Daedalea quercina L-15889]|uniref:Uncharacterized protein n=1 Tax=Daedalea quercina L-15889 TaxID=1314783 RepID=A0A165NUP9_9APHY|nr:hypothetical protein DAEQUDRAFT_729032 [Daedalea quercina L-15889]